MKTSSLNRAGKIYSTYFSELWSTMDFHNIPKYDLIERLAVVLILQPFVSTGDFVMTKTSCWILAKDIVRNNTAYSLDQLLSKFVGSLCLCSFTIC